MHAESETNSAQSSIIYSNLDLDLTEVNLEEPHRISASTEAHFLPSKKKTPPCWLRPTIFFVGIFFFLSTFILIAELFDRAITDRGHIPSDIKLDETYTHGYAEEGLLICGSTVSSKTFGSPSYTLPSCSDSFILDDRSITGHWYTFFGNASCVKLSTCDEGTDFDTSIRVFTGREQHIEEYTCIAANDDAKKKCDIGDDLSIVSFETEPHEIYSVFIGGTNLHEGSYTLTLSCGEC